MLALRIAFRYLIGLRKSSTVQRLSVLSFVGVTLGSMAMLIVLSAFNGFEDLLHKLYHFQDPDFRIVSASSRTFTVSGMQWQAVSKLDHLASFYQVVEDKAALSYGDGQMVVEVTGVDPEVLKVSRLDSTLIAGNFSLGNDTLPLSLVSIPVQQALNVSLKDHFSYLQLSYPKRKKLLNLGSGRILNKLNVRPSGILRLEENRIYLPLNEVRELMDKPNGATSLFVFVKDPERWEEVKTALKELFPSPYQVLDETEQHADLFRIMKIEKLFVFLAVGFIILISTFNLFVSCSMLVLDKQRDIHILSAIGMPSGKVGDIIRNVGLLVTVLGLAIGLLLGWALCFLQQRYGFVPLGMASTLLQSYPIDIKLLDFLWISLWVVGSGFIALIKPYKMASRFALSHQRPV